MHGNWSQNFILDLILRYQARIRITQRRTMVGHMSLYRNDRHDHAFAGRHIYTLREGPNSDRRQNVLHQFHNCISIESTLYMAKPTRQISPYNWDRLTVVLKPGPFFRTASGNITLTCMEKILYKLPAICYRNCLRYRTEHPSSHTKRPSIGSRLSFRST